ncbi:hypothetical protein [Marinoscillum furvescens]|uniref:Uncharacterized protein n=1 Tax=Marinoscillum furvescens DSM 4134 TaxID=1122208 RepID=A0A3D9LGH9_MARFU|nr:hypothetical protein [Marinoscillum furvescens]REE05790.1 hypothetical protein C7460_101309 [Marinoscillum furvescens DSM 4134]
MSNNTLKDDMLKARLVLQHTADNEEIRMQLATHGYDEQYLYRGFTLYEIAQQRLELLAVKPADVADEASSHASEEAIRRLMAWMVDFVAISRRAMRAQPQYLEVMGIEP